MIIPVHFVQPEECPGFGGYKSTQDVCVTCPWILDCYKAGNPGRFHLYAPEPKPVNPPPLQQLQEEEADLIARECIRMILSDGNPRDMKTLVKDIEHFVGEPYAESEIKAECERLLKEGRIAGSVDDFLIFAE